MPKTVPFTECLLDTHLLVDVRTPLEYAEDHLPGAINVPLLSNEERVEIGTLYKQQGPNIARIRGLELTAAKFPAMVAEIAANAAGRPILVYCWRGGLRSRTVTEILDLTGYHAFQLSGGHKAFRQQVVEYFDPFTPPAPLVVLHGMTGIGKTTFLELLKGRGHAVIDLEGIACHRGSAFGALGLSQAHLTQKSFETALWKEFRSVGPVRAIILEGESRRIGKLFLPGNLHDVMRDSIKVWCAASLETRVKRLINEYGKPEFMDDMTEALDRIKKKLGGDNHRELLGHLERWEMGHFMQGLMERYYDRTYYRTRDWTEDFALSLEDFEAAADELERQLEHHIPKP
ncbi:tRNA 2-selenouridine synthase [Geobacter sp. OR-1]|uniref:tRNA 2-selenouridine(34) synthase MnmH n=1 Tax=Geobacter sp. OR-1 TaxID=1266765 RepID=UPI000541ADC8|nr:tRNA 2-selenouridine(34) synthase MnmH [Geobacter sp. OR-1]GAM08086.1 tRNA 2-selenouridine synthase [Geobacter sp. OR-1]